MTKKELRQIYLTKRKNLSPIEREQRSVEIIELLLRNFDLKGKTFSVFLPIDKFNEIITWPLLSIQGRITLPVVREGSDLLEHVVYQGKDQLNISSWGIPEPQYGDVIAPEEHEIVLVPLLAIDQNGYRVGYGKGFYDKFLSACNPGCKFIGLSFWNPIEKIEDTFEGDVPLHFCITPDSVISFT